MLDIAGVNGLARESIDHYVVSGCATDFSGTAELDTLVVQLGEARDAVRDLKDIIASDQPAFETACGGTAGSLDPVMLSLEAMKLASNGFLVIGADAQSLLSCKELNGIYLGLSHGAVCKYMPETLAWMFVTMSIILIAGMTLVTFRAALRPDVLTEDQRRYFFDDEEEDFKRSPSSETPFPASNRTLNTRGQDEFERSVDGQSQQGRYDDATADYTEDQRNDTGYYEDEHDVEISRLPTNEGGGVQVQRSARNLNG